MRTTGFVFLYKTLLAAAVTLLLPLSAYAQDTAAAPVRSDPRCAAWVADGASCGLLSAEPNPSFHADSSTCTRGQSCASCIDPQLLADAANIVGDVTANQNTRVNLQVPNWLTVEIVATVFHLIGRDVLGFNIQPYQSVNDAFQSLCCGASGATKGPIVQLEGWPSTSFPEDDGYFSMLKLPIGYEGASGLFVKKTTTDKHPLATSHNAYKYLPEYSHIFPKAYSIPWEYAVFNTSKPASDATNYRCATNTWTNTTCGPLGRYVPPQCEGDRAQYCQELILAMPTWDRGFFEGLIKNTGLNFTAVYVGYSNHIALVDSLPDPLFYWWEPDSLVAKHNARQVTFNPASVECQRVQNADPTLNEADCQYPRSALFKAARRDEMAQHPQLKLLFESFSFGLGEMNSMLQQHPSGGGTSSVHNISCRWLNDNFATWSSWLRPAPTTTTTTTTSGLGSGAVAAIVIVPLLIIIAIVAALSVAKAFLGGPQKSTEFAPTSPPLALIFTDVEASTHLWETYGATMGLAMEVHHDVIRAVIAEHEAYEIKVVGDAFMVACASTTDALSLCATCQTRLNDAEWPEPLVNWKHVEDPQQAQLFRGLRVRMGFHHCTNVDAKYDDVHHGYDYYGPEVNLTARIQSVAKGGQILMGDETLRAIRQTEDYHMLREELEVTKFASGVELKGVAEPIVVFSIVPSTLEGRLFDPIPGAKDECGGERSMSKMQASASETMSQFGGGENPIGFCVGKVFAAIPNTKDKDAVLNTALQNFKLPTTGSYARRYRNFLSQLRVEWDRKNNVGGQADRFAGSFMSSARRGSVRAQLESSTNSASSAREAKSPIPLKLTAAGCKASATEEKYVQDPSAVDVEEMECTKDENCA